LKDDEKELRERWDRDAPKCWQIMPWDQAEWWVLENGKTVTGRFYATEKEAFRVAYEHNSKTYGIHTVLVWSTHGHWEWKRQP
jgi:hypothetical protein